jgi:hypothetical protein
MDVNPNTAFQASIDEIMKRELKRCKRNGSRKWENENQPEESQP